MRSTLSRTTVLLLAAAALLPAGCRNNRHSLELLERENRLLEDKIYDLEDVVREYRDALETCQMRNGSGDGDEYYLPAKRDKSSESEEPRVLTDAPDAGPADLVPPSVELFEEETEQEESQPNTITVPDVPEDIRGPANNDSPAEPAGDAGTEDKATHLFINADLCGGYDDDNTPGDDGISVSVEPRNARGQTVSAAGDLIVVVRDPNLSGDDAHVARWEFTAEQLAEVFDISSNGEMNLTLSWPDSRPLHESLDLYVRYVTPDGRKLDAKQPIGVRLAGSSSRSSDGWTLARNPVRQRVVERAAAIVPVEDNAIEDAATEAVVVVKEAPITVEDVRSHREAVVQAAYEEPVVEEKPTTAALPAWSPNRP